jgi:uncharacterized protein YukE
MAGGISTDAAAAYAWVSSPLTELQAALPPVTSMKTGAIDGMIDSGVKGFLEITGLESLLEEVTGKPQELHAAGALWLEQAKATHELCAQLQAGAKPLQSEWEGQGSGAFGGFMGTLFQQLESMADDMAQTATILNSAAQECQLAEDMIVMIIREAIEWYLMDLAATAVADIFTLGLATFVGAAAASAEAVVFVERATKVSKTLGKVLEDLQKMLKELKEAGEAIKAAKGFKATYESFKDAQKITKDLRKAGGALAAAKAVKAARAGEEGAQAAFGAAKAFKIGDKLVRGGVASGIGGVTGTPSEVGYGGLAKDVFGGTKETLSTPDGHAVAERGLDAANGTAAPEPAPYTLPEQGPSSLRGKLDALTTFANETPKPAGAN